ncbi:hypothetical protein Np050604_202 [Cyanophage S-RIM44]|uniref:Uncharacterized protein n=2 Tax=Vellamovirus TaxID=2733139 RepID=A0A127KMX3_9CAUD|nr:hypothetical protein Syn1_204 [Prochlorococcus phage Syn1]AMO43442.1 hypothetical protein W270710_202 [Cyanophage S-RIM44]ADO99301.1 hypothetical protein Syn1_204 [Prochlorococcus phage Syn1]AOO11914.1 hypothetical protein Np050604_202 [Cyanophage S-RIM44]AOO12615.1 hypothetical protein Sn080709_202 [Cyanophage S-RIM44]AOO13081.1 hypothetical protein W2100709_203 [Cyanophage S-RIM44]
MSNSRNDLDFIRDMLIMALNEKRDNIIGDLFKMYEQVQNRPTIPDGNINIDKLVTGLGTEYNFNLSSEYLDSSVGNIEIGSSLNNDVISFGDYTS